MVVGWLVGWLVVGCLVVGWLIGCLLVGFFWCTTAGSLPLKVSGSPLMRLTIASLLLQLLVYIHNAPVTFGHPPPSISEGGIINHFSEEERESLVPFKDMFFSTKTARFLKTLPVKEKQNI